MEQVLHVRLNGTEHKQAARKVQGRYMNRRVSIKPLVFVLVLSAISLVGLNFVSASLYPTTVETEDIHSVSESNSVLFETASTAEQASETSDENTQNTRTNTDMHTSVRITSGSDPVSTPQPSNNQDSTINTEVNVNGQALVPNDKGYLRETVKTADSDIKIRLRERTDDNSSDSHIQITVEEN